MNLFACPVLRETTSAAPRLVDRYHDFHPNDYDKQILLICEMSWFTSLQLLDNFVRLKLVDA